MKYRIGLCLLLLVGCPTDDPDDEDTRCIGSLSQITVPLGVVNQDVVVTATGASAFLLGRVGDADSGARIESSGALSRVSVSGAPATSVEFDFMCVTEGRTVFRAEIDGEADPQVEINCVPCDGATDATEDFINSLLKQAATYTSGFIDLIHVKAAVLTELASLRADALAHAQGSQEPLAVVPASPPPDGDRDDASQVRDDDDLVLIAMTVDAAIPQSPDHSLIYSAVFDSDGVEANNWVFVPPFDWDLFQGADRWYQLLYDHTAGAWSLTVTQVDEGQSTAVVLSEAFAMVNDATVTFFIPGEELPGDAVTFRATTFGHDGAFSEDDRGADVLGANPTEPMRPLE